MLGSVLLARAALAVGDDPAAASALLDGARFAAPGTLVEEAALRRSILIAAERDDLATFERMVSRYLRKFRTSVYAGNFRRRLASALTRMSFVRDPSTFARLEALLQPMPASGRQELYLLVARAAVEGGNPVAGQMAARRVLELAEPDTLDHRRARLYQAAAEVVDAPLAAAARTTLGELAAEQLPATDRALLNAAIALARSVTELPAAALAPAPRPATDPDTSAPAGDSIEATTQPRIQATAAPVADMAAQAGPFGAPAALERRVADAIAATDALLETAR